MATEEILRKTLKNADGKPFAKYKGLKNTFTLENYELIVDEVQNDRMGHSRMRVRVPLKSAGFPEDTYNTESRRIALRDLIARRFWESARTNARSPIPKTDGGEIYIPRPGQEILARNSVIISQYFIEVRFTADFPSVGGKANATAMEILLFSRLDTLVKDSLYYSCYKQSKLYNHLQTNEDANAIRAALNEKGLVAFIGIGSILPRRSDDLAPMTDAQPFECDESLMVEIQVPNAGTVKGMGIPKGFTAITGPSRNGKSCLADAVFAGIYNHIPGDGREMVISLNDASFLISEGGRPADNVDISMFADASPEFADTSKAVSNLVSSPISELVSASEALEMGSHLLILDEEYSNPSIIRRGFLAIDDDIVSMSELGQAMSAQGVSVIMVTGDEKAIRSAENVILVNGFKASKVDVEHIVENRTFRMPSIRYPVSKNILFEKGRKEVSTSAVSIRNVEIGEYKISVPVAGLFDMAQTRALADALVFAKDLMDGSRSMYQVCTEAVNMMETNDLESEDGQGMHHATVRPIDLAAVINRHPQMLAIQKS